VIRPAEPGDAAALAAIHAEAFPPGERWGEAAIRQMLALPGAWGLVGGKGDAFLLARVAADEAELLTVAVRPAERRQGLARALVERAGAQAAALGAATMFLEVAEGNAAALCLYAALGFAPRGRRPNYYGAGRDARLLALPLRSTSLP